MLAVEVQGLQPGDVFGFVPETPETSQAAADWLGGPPGRINPELVIHTTPQYIRVLLCKHDGSFKRLTYMREDADKWCRWHHKLPRDVVDLVDVLSRYKEQALSVQQMYDMDIAHLKQLSEKGN